MMYDIGIIISCYNEEDSIKELYDEIICSIKKSKKINKYKLYFINDNSSDDTIKIIKSIKDKNINIINFKKRMGKSVGLEVAFKLVSKNLDLIFMMDADLQDDPNEFDRFITKIEEGYDLVTGYKKKRLDSKEKKFASKIYNKILNLIFNMNLHDHNCGFKCFRSNIIDKIKIYDNLHRFITVLVKYMGYKVSEIEVKHHKRKYGKSKYGITRYFIGFKDILRVKYIVSYKDIKYIFFNIFFSAIILIISLFINKVFFFLILIVLYYIYVNYSLLFYESFNIDKIKKYININK